MTERKKRNKEVKEVRKRVRKGYNGSEKRGSRCEKRGVSRLDVSWRSLG